MPPLTRTRLVEILEACRSVSVGVLGDFSLDAYWYADMARSQLSRETPLFPRPVVRETYSLGGAANVAWNLADLGAGEVHAFTVCGDDWRRELLVDLLERHRIRTDSILIQPGWLTPFYGKVILCSGDIQQEDARLDFINQRSPAATTVHELMQRLETQLSSLNALILADFQPVGVFTAEIREAVNSLVKRYPGVRFVADSREHIGDFLSALIKPNEMEATRLLFPGQPPQSISLDELTAAARELHAQTRQPLVITRGEQGCLLFDQGMASALPAVRLPPPLDPVGAGDTFLATLTACLAAGARTWEACLVANLATAVTVRQLHVTGTASPDQILGQFDLLPQVPNADQWAGLYA